MNNIKLNPGGLIGALVFGGIAGAIVFSVVDLNNAGRGAIKIPIIALIAGAFAGNYAWGLIFKNQ